MSKKIAGGAKNIVLDVKTGSGAFMKTVEDAKILAENMVKIGKGCGRNVCALITNMDTPLGTHIGNALEVKEAVKVLKGEQKDDLYEICVSLSAAIVSLCKGEKYEDSQKAVINTLESGEAFEKMRQWIEAQGGDIEQIDDTDKLPTAAFKYEVKSQNEGYITKMDAEKIGIASVVLGAGREKKEDKIDFGAGIILNKKTGDSVKKGDTLCTLFSNNESLFKGAEEKFLSALKIDSNPAEQNPLIYEIIK